jgi:hypothetical protein
VPHFDVTTLDGSHVRYRDLWQHRNLVFVSVGEDDHASRNYACDLQCRRSDFDAADTSLVISTDTVDGLPAPGVLVADRWGEIVELFMPARSAPMPSADELLEWIAFVRMQCPECPAR